MVQEESGCEGGKNVEMRQMRKKLPINNIGF